MWYEIRAPATAEERAHVAAVERVVFERPRDVVVVGLLRIMSSFSWGCILGREICDRRLAMKKGHGHVDLICPCDLSAMKQ